MLLRSLCLPLCVVTQSACGHTTLTSILTVCCPPRDYGNTSPASTYYVLAYLESLVGVKKGQRLMQVRRHAGQGVLSLPARHQWMHETVAVLHGHILPAVPSHLHQQPTMQTQYACKAHAMYQFVIPCAIPTVSGGSVMQVAAAPAGQRWHWRKSGC